MTRARDVSNTQASSGGAVPPFAAGKNKIINGDFYVNQRAFTTMTTSGTYGFDRWVINSSTSDGTTTYSAQTFTTGAAPVAGYEAANFARVDTTGQTTTAAFSILNQHIENVRTLAGQTATISFWAKAASGTPKVAVEITQGFGSGGSPSAAVNTYVSQVTLSTSWTRYSVNVNVPSISGKTIGTTANTSVLRLLLWVSAGSDFNARTGSLGIQTNTFDIWGVQIEAGSTATAFQTATGTIQGELAACQRYYVRFASSDAYAHYAMGSASQTNTTDFPMNLPVTLRVPPTSIDYSNIGTSDGANGILTGGTFAIPSATNGNDKFLVRYSKTGATQFRPYYIINNAGAGYIGFSAEL